MATPLSPARFRAALTNEGVRVVGEGDWENHNRNHMGAWGPVHGVMIHHTATDADRHDAVGICRHGYADLPGPLCHGVITKDGRTHLVGYGRANHAGGGDVDVLAAVIAERFPLPADTNARTDGNRYFYGFECENRGDGVDGWPEAQVEAIARAAAGICRAHGWSERSVIGHREWQPGKIDPYGPIGTADGPDLTMTRIRARVAQLLDDDPAPAPAPGKPKPPAATEPFPGARFFADAEGRPLLGKRSDVFTRMGRRLVAVGCGRYQVGPGPELGRADIESYEAWQRKCGYSGADAQWPPGPGTWDALKVPRAA
ncbi:N-acetylmuramoyl-L-alanine amidase [Streptomyces buecherae]|uniref:N-acetylmuramoyl-L-alanine amidase n=1 Tax=Streptomyces buecherae TaxID=2763006 RepID=A0A7H8NAX0_9ACTN|nr:N-acetylmuramoyl-L-alanine amidase [Streptomyces buecherae]QKW51679.1 N-acetylmuramoyl-L-alanine amidase [Streptomyces buecherae]